MCNIANVLQNCQQVPVNSFLTQTSCPRRQGHPTLSTAGPERSALSLCFWSPSQEAQKPAFKNRKRNKERKAPRALFWGNAVANLTASQLLCSVTQGVTPVCAAWDARVGKFVQKESRAEVRVFVTSTHSNSQVNFTYTEKCGSSPLVALSQGCTTPPRSAGATVLILYSFSYSTSTPNALLPKL